MPLAAIFTAAAFASGCGGGAPAAGTQPPPSRSVPASVARPAQTAGSSRGACALVSAADLSSVGVAGAITAVAASACTWGMPPAPTLGVVYKPRDPAAASQLPLVFGGRGVVVAGVGDGARGLFSLRLESVAFVKGSAFAVISLTGPGAAARKTALIMVAKNVASHL